MALIDNVNLANDGVFQSRVLASATSAALAIIGETPGPNSAKRQQYAVAVIGPQGSLFAASIARAVAAHDPSLGVAYASGGQAAITDAQISSAVSAVWDDLAGVTSA